MPPGGAGGLAVTKEAVTAGLSPSRTCLCIFAWWLDRIERALAWCDMGHTSPNSVDRCSTLMVDSCQVTGGLPTRRSHKGDGAG